MSQPTRSAYAGHAGYRGQISRRAESPGTLLRFAARNPDLWVRFGLDLWLEGEADPLFVDGPARTGDVTSDADAFRSTFAESLRVFQRERRDPVLVGVNLDPIAGPDPDRLAETIETLAAAHLPVVVQSRAVDAVAASDLASVLATAAHVQSVLAVVHDPLDEMGARVLAAINECAGRGVVTGLVLRPFELSASEANVAQAVSRTTAALGQARAAGAVFAAFGPVLGCGEPEYFWPAIAGRHITAAMQAEAEADNADRPGDALELVDRGPAGPWAQAVPMLARVARSHDLKLSAPRWLPQDFREINYAVAEILLDEARFAELTGQRFRSQYWAGINVDDLSRSLASLAERGQLSRVRSLRPALQERVASELLPRLTRGSAFFEGLARSKQSKADREAHRIRVYGHEASSPGYPAAHGPSPMHGPVPELTPGAAATTPGLTPEPGGRKP